jgi:membrane dipeptidase
VRRNQKSKKNLRLGLTIGSGLAAILGMIIFSLGPSFVAARLNPVSDVELAPISSETQTLHQSLAITDLHADSLLWGRNLAELAKVGQVDIPRLRQGNVALQVFTVVTKVPAPLRLEGNSNRSDDITKLAILQRWPIPAWFSLKQRALHQANQFSTLAAAGQLIAIKTSQDLQNYLTLRQRNPKLTAGLLGLEGAHALEGKLENVDLLYQAGFRLIGLAHFFDNEVSGSAHGLKRGGLTPFGRDVLKRMTDLDMVVDLAHASSQTIDQVLQITKRPVLISHTGVKGTCDNPRNLSDRQLQQIAQNDGLIGIGFWKTAVCGQEAAAVAQAIRYASDKIGVEHVALGSDFDGAVRMPFDVANLAQVTQALQIAGFTEPEIAKIMGLNALNFFQKLLPDGY